MSEIDETVARAAEPSKDELAAMIEAASNPPTEAEIEQEPDPEPEVDEVADEPEVEAAQAEDETADEEPAGDDDPIAELRLRLEAAEAEAKHHEAVAGRYTGELGYLRQQNRTLEDRLARLESQPKPDADEYDEAPRRVPSVPQPPEQPGSDYLVQLASQRALQAFAASNPDAVQGGNLAPEMVKVLSDSAAEINELGRLRDPAVVEREVRRHLDIAYLRYNRDKRIKELDEFRSRRADQAAGLKDKKRAATVTRGKKTAAPRSSFNINKASKEELAALIEASQ